MTSWNSSIEDGLMVGITTVSTEKQAETLACLAVENRLAACVSFKKTCSIYRWKNEISRDDEYEIVFKFRADQQHELQAWLVQAHPYELPQWVCFSVKASPEYLSWALS